MNVNKLTEPWMPRLPVLGWQTFAGKARTQMPSVLDRTGVLYTTSGRASILLALEVLGVGLGDRVLIPTYHCPTMVAPIVERGACPLFFPVDRSGAPAWEWLADQDLAQVRAILAPHYFGIPQPMQRLRDWCDEHGIALIEDCAHAMFGETDGQPVGSWGDLAIASLTKFLPVQEGGCLVSRDNHAWPSLRSAGWKVQLKSAIDMIELGATHDRLVGLNALLRGAMSVMRRLLRREVLPTSASRERPASGASFDGLSMDVALAHREIALPCRWIAGHAPRQRIVSRRRRHYRMLSTALSGHPGFHPLLPKLPLGAAPYVMPLWVNRPDPGYAELRRLGVPVSRWDWLWPGVATLPNDHGLNWSSHVLQIACHQDLTDDDIVSIANTLNRIFTSIEQ